MFGWAQNVFRKCNAGVNLMRRWHWLGGCLLLVGCATPLVTPPAEMRPVWLTQPLASEHELFGVGASPIGEQYTSALRRARMAAVADLLTQLKRALLAEAPSQQSSSLDAWYSPFAHNGVDQLAQAPIQWLDDWESTDGIVYAWVGLERTAAAHYLQQVYQRDWPRVPWPVHTDWPSLQQWAGMLATAGEQRAHHLLHQWLVGVPIDPGWEAYQAELGQAWQAHQAGMPIGLFLSEATPVDIAPWLIQPWASAGFVFAQGAWQLKFHVTGTESVGAESEVLRVNLEVFLFDPEATLRWQFQTQQQSHLGQSTRQQMMQQLAETAFAAFQEALLN